MITEPFLKEEMTHLSLKNWDTLIKGLVVGFTTKNGGISNDPFSTLNLGLHVNDEPGIVVENRGILAEKTSIPLQNWIFAEQVHSFHIKKVTSKDRGKGTTNYSNAIPGCDGFYTNESNIMLSLCFADCVPLFFLAPEERLIGVAHAGWKGTVNDIGGKMVKLWKENEGVNPDSIKVAIGPAIGPCCYIVDDRVIASIHNKINEKYPLSYSVISKGQYKLDLKQLNKYSLLEAGVKEENIVISQQCTSCETDLFFSHRRDKGKTGRMLSFIGLNEEA